MSKALGRMMLLLCALMSAQAFAQTIAISSPSAGDSWGRGAKHAITWSSSGVTDSVRIEYITGGVATTLAAAADNNGDYEWDVPASQTLGSYTVRLTSVADATITATSGAFDIVNAALALIAPNGGETWALETTRDIKWTSDAGGNVRIDLLNSGSVYATIAESIANSGSYSWSIPEFTVIPAGDYTVKISLVNNQSVSCVSTDTFALYNPNVTAPVTVTNPTGGESWVIGSQHQVTWDSIVGGTVKIDLFQYYYPICTMLAAGDGGGTFRIAGNQTANLVSGDIMAITDSTGNNGYYNVSSVTGVQDYIVTATKSKMPEDEDQVSGGPYPGFCIAGWKAIGVPGKVGSGEFTYNDGLVVYGSPGNDGNYTIRGAENVTIGGVNHTWIYLQETTIPSTNFGGNILRTVITTNTGVYNATADGYISKIVKNIAAEVDNSAATNSYAWTIPVDQPAGLHFGIRVTSNLKDKWTGGSAEELTLSPEPYILLQSPNGGESWAANASQTVKWDSNAGGDVKLEYSANGGVNWTTIVASAPNSGSYSWKTPNATGDTYLLKITSTADAAVTCTSAAPFSLTAPNITVLSPAGGENWAVGRTFPISWTSNLIGVGGSDANVAIYLSSDAGATWSTIVASTANVGLYYWQIPADQQVGDQYKVKIVSAAATGVSPATFAISGKPFVQVTSPSLGDIWAVGAQRSITWETNIQGYVKIELYQNDLKKADIVSSTANNGSYLWMSPGPAGTGYTVKVTSATDESVTDSSELFNIAAVANITVTSPTGTDSWAAGTAQTIAWTSNIGGNVKLELGQGGSWTTMVTGISNALPSNSYTWNIPVGTAAGSYQVRITSESNGAVSPVASFAITAPSITVTAPAAGVIWGKGGASGNSSHLITWDSTAAASNSVAIFYSANGVAPWHSITDAIPNSGSYTWSMPSSLTVGSGYKIEVRSVVTPSIKGASNAFSVAAPAIDMQIEDGSPNGGEAWLAGSPHDIVWYSNIGGNVSIQLYKGGSPVSTISASYTNSDENGTLVHDMYKQTYSWILPTTLASGTDYTVVVRSLSLTGIEGMTTSLGKFTISSVPYLNVLSPAVGDICCRGLAKNILWESNAGGRVKIEFGKLVSTKVSAWTTLIESTPNDGAYQWTLASDLALGDYTVRVSGVEDQDLSVESGTFAVEDAKLAISVPATGAVLGQGSTVSLAWASNIGGNVKIALYKGASLNSVLAAETENDGSFTWQVPATQTVGSDYTVMITSLALPSVTASSGAFAVAAPSLVITYPNGGESLVYSTVETIAWMSNLSGNVKIELYQDSKLAGVIASSTPDSGTYEWTLPSDSTLVDSGYKIQISSLDGQTPLVDLSDAAFAIVPPTIAVTSPASGSKWKTGQAYDIAWTCNFTGKVDIDLLKGGTVHSSIATGVDCGAAYEWTVPVSLEADTDYSIQVTYSLDKTINAVSGNFTVVKTEYIAITTPNGGEDWAPGSSHEIKWQTSFDVETNVKISLLWNGEFCQEIAKGTANDGSYTWAIPSDVATGLKYRIQIVSMADSTIRSTSAANFTISSGYLKVLVPNTAAFDKQWEATGGYTYSTKADSADFDGDGNLDVYVANYGAADVVLFGDGKGYFDRSVAMSTVNNSQYVVTADVDSDNDMDAVVAHSDGGAVIWLNDGNGNFTQGQVLSSGSGALSVAVGDVNGDGLNDIVVGFAVNYKTYYSWQVWVNNASAKGTFTLSQHFDNGYQGVVDIKLADIDSDGDLDVVLAKERRSNVYAASVMTFLNQGTGNFEERQTMTIYNDISAIALGDFDGDNLPDLFVARSNNSNVILRNNGDRWFDSWQTLNSNASHGVALVDLDGDQSLDAVVSDAAGNTNAVYLNSGNGTLKDSGQPVQDTDNSMSVIAADFNSDGSADLFFTDYAARNKLFVNVGTVRWSVGTKHDIVWSSNIGGMAKLELGHGDDSDFVLDDQITAAADNGGIQNTYSWTVPVDQTPRTDYMIRITSGSFTKFSGNFTIQYGTYLFVKSPDGGESWIAGSGHDIQWNSNFVGDVRVEYTLNATADTPTWELIADADATRQQISWTIPDTASSDDCKIRLTSLSDTTLTDMSDAIFSIGQEFIVVTSPASDEKWPLGSQQTITWATNLGNSYSDISLFKDGALVRRIASGVTNSGTYAWLLPDTLEAGSGYQVQLDCGTASDSSDEFSITTESFIQLLSPVGGEQWALGTQRNITWNSNLDDNLLIYLYENGVFKKQLSSGVAASVGKYSWSIPSDDADIVKGPGYTVLLASASQAAVQSSSPESFTLEAAPKLTLSAPNGSERWTVGSQHRIVWTSNAGGKVKIELGHYSNATWNFDSTVAASQDNSSPQGSYTWTIPPGQFPANDYRIRVSVIGGTLSAQSSDNFAIVPGNYIIVSSPNGGEDWIPGQSYSIKWLSNYGGKVDLYYSADGGNDWSGTIKEDVSNAESSNAYTWNTPSTLVEGSHYLVKIVSRSDKAVFDASDSEFMFNAAHLNVTSPNGDETWSVGSEHAITWSSNLSADSEIKILLWDDSDSSIIASRVGNTGTYTWSLPLDLAVGDSYKVELTVLDSGDTAASDNDFSINNNPYIDVTSPVGGESWAFGTTRSITWNTNMDSTGKVRVDLYSSGVWLKTIAASAENTGVYSWTLPGSSELIAGANFTVQVTSVDQAFVHGASATTFEIGAAFVTQMSPNGGETLIAGTKFLVTWNSNIGGTAKLELFNGVGNFAAGITSTASNASYTNSYLWTVPAAEFIGTGYMVKVTSNVMTDVSDYSDGAFSIIQGPYLTLSSPNGGERLAITSNTDLMPVIKWDSNLGGKVTLEYSVASGFEYLPIATVASTPDTYRWDTSALTVGSTYRVRVSSVVNSSYSDASGADFSLGAENLSNVVVGAGTDGNRYVGGVYGITWSSNLGGTVKIDLLQGGTSVLKIADAASNSGTYSWTVKDQLLPGDYQIRITSNLAGTSATSATFNLRNQAFAIKLTAPAGGAKLKKGREYEITWYTTQQLGTILIEFSPALGATGSWTQIAKEAPNTGSYQWSIPTDQDSSNNCLIKITSNIAGTNVSDQNLTPFSIVDPGAYDIIVPNGGEYWAAGTTREVRWQSYVPGEYVKLELYRSGVLVPASESGLPSNLYSSFNNYNWDIPSTLATSDNYRIKVSNVSNPTDYDLSDANFQISPPTLLLTYPTGSEEWVKSQQRVKWYTNRNNAIIVDLLRGDFINLDKTDNAEIITTQGTYYANYFYISGLWGASNGDFFSPGDSFVVENSESAPLPVTYYFGISQVIEDTANQQTILVWVSDTAVPKSLNDGRLSWLYNIQWLVSNGVGYIDWEVPTGSLTSGRDIIPADDTYKIRVSAAKAIEGTLDSVTILATNAGQDFSIVDRADIYLDFTSPSAGVHWARGFDQTISWETNLGGPLRVSLWSGDAELPVAISLMLPEEAENLPNSGSYTWAVPENLPSGDAYRVQLSSTLSGLSYEPKSYFFSIVTDTDCVQITAPADGAVVACGSQQHIAWTTTTAFGNRKVALYKGGVKLDAAVSGIPDTELGPDSTSLEWSVPAVSTALPVASDYKIRVSRADDDTVYGENAAPFSIGYVAVTAPADGARWALGTSHTITWQSDTKAASKVNLYLYRNSGFNSQIAANVENNGSYTWTIPNDGSLNPSPDAIPPAKLIYDYYVVVVSVGDSAYQGRSVNYFRLEQSKTVTVLVPNGEENWGIGQYYNIKWFSNIGGHVVITLGYYDAAGNWNQDDANGVIASMASDSGNVNTYRWLVPDSLTPRSDYRVKVTGYENPEANDVSDYDFAIGPRSYIILTSPNGGEQWVLGNTYDITWKTNVAATVDIFYSTNSGVNWTLLKGGYSSADGVYSWDTSDSAVANISAGDNYRVKVASTADVNIVAASESDFAIRDSYIQVVAPTNGQVVAIGSIFQIKWLTNLDKSLAIGLYKGGDQVDTIIASVIATPGVYQWAVSSSLPAGNDYQLGFSVASGAGATVMSDPFTLQVKDFIQIRSPLDGEKWAAGSTRPITWISNLPATEQVSIDLYQDDLWTSLIAKATANTGTYSWTIPATQANGNYKVKISSVKAADVFSISIGDFLIGQPTVSLSAPNGGQRWVIGRTYDISWESNVGGTVSIQLDKGGVIQTLMTGVDNATASHVQGVRMPISLVPGNDYKVVVVSESNSAWTDSSDNVFTLMPGEYFALTAPVGGETLYNGPTDYFDITWESNVGGNAKLSYSNTALESWTVIPGADSVAATKGTFRWSTSGLPTGSLYKVKIESLSASDLSSKSSAYFSVNQKDYLVLSSPVGGESWVVGSTQNITWGANIGGNLKIELLNNGVLSSVIVAETSAGNKSYAWKIPSTQNVGSNFKIRITSLQNAALTSTSAGNFTLTAPYITILSPVGGEIYSQNGTYDIRWTSSGVADSVRVELLKGVKVTTIAERVAVASGSYSWTIPADQASGEDYKIRVSSVANASTTSVSPSFFQITSFPPVISIEPDSQLRVQLAQGRSTERQLVVGNVGGMSLNWTIDDNYTVDSFVYTDTGVGSDTAAYTDTDYSTWTKIDGLGDDTVVGPIGVGFDFPLYGQAFSSFYVSSNGWISFSADGYEAISPVELPSALAPENVVAMFWQDLNFTMGGSAYYKQVDANTFVLAFEGVQLNNFDGSVTCRMLLGRDGSVKVLYQSVVAAAAATAVVGVQDGFKTKGFTADPDMIAAGVVVELRPFWPSLSVSSGTVDPNNKQNVVLTFSSVGWAAGTYQTTIEVASEDEGVESKFLEVEFIVTDVSSLAVDDFDASGSSDLLFRNAASGGMYVNLVDGMSILDGGSLYQSGADWDLAGVGDLNNDLKKDIVVQNAADGGIYAFLMDGANPAAAKFLCQSADSGWGVAGLADLNGDGKSDVVLRNSASGAVYLWIMNGLEIVAQDYLLLGGDSVWEFGGLADLNGDGRADIVLRNATNGAIYVYLMNGLKVVGQGFAWNGGDSKWTIGGFGKFDDDANADMLLCYEGGKDGFVWLMDGVKPKSGDFVWKSSDQITWQFKAVGDFNGDGRTDILLRDASTAALYIFLMDGSAASASGHILGGGDTAWDVAKVGDYNGDGKSDIMLENQAEGEGHLYLIEGLSVSAHGLVWINAQDWKLR